MLYPPAVLLLRFSNILAASRHGLSSIWGFAVMSLFVGFVGFKGGTGKTILCFQMAERALAAGLKVCVVDLDPELSSRDHFLWRSQRELSTWDLEVKDVSRAPEREMFDGSLDSYDIVFCDFPGFNSDRVREYMDRMDLMLAPISASPQDRTVNTSLGFLGQRRSWPLYFVVNHVAVSSKRARSLLEDLFAGEFQICPVMVSRWVLFHESSEWGYGVCEYAPESRAAAQVVRLWSWLDETLGTLVESRLAAAV